MTLVIDLSTEEKLNAFGEAMQKATCCGKPVDLAAVIKAAELKPVFVRKLAFWHPDLPVGQHVRPCYDKKRGRIEDVVVANPRGYPFGQFLVRWEDGSFSDEHPEHLGPDQGTNSQNGLTLAPVKSGGNSVAMRINKGHIDIIVARAIKASFEKREAAQVKEEVALAVRAYNSIHSPDIRKKVAAVPPEWFRHCQCMNFTVNGQYHRLDAGKDMPTRYDTGCHNNGALSGNVAEEVVAFDQRKDDLKKQKYAAEAKLRGTLSNISTFAKLTELWPEGKPYYKDLDEDAKVKGGLPAIRFDDVNAILNIGK